MIESSFEAKVLEAMEKAQFHIEGTIAWGSRKFQRFRIKNSCSRGKPLFVRFFNGGVTFGDWRDWSKENWITVFEKQYRECSLEEKVARKKEELLLLKEAQTIANDAAYRCHLLLSHRTWRGKTCEHATKEGVPLHPYAKNKKIIPYNSFVCRSSLLIPLFDINLKFRSIQFIKPNGFKRFKRDVPTNGLMGWLSLDPLFNPPSDIYICEGYATGCTIQEIIKKPVICAMSAANLLTVALDIRKKFAYTQIHICADNDQGGKVNVGLKSARKVLKHIKAVLHYPEFKGLFIRNKPSDFNDLAALEGKEEVQKQLSIERI